MNQSDVLLDEARDEVVLRAVAIQHDFAENGTLSDGVAWLLSIDYGLTWAYMGDSTHMEIDRVFSIVPGRESPMRDFIRSVARPWELLGSPAEERERIHAANGRRQLRVIHPAVQMIGDDGELSEPIWLEPRIEVRHGGGAERDEGEPQE